MINSRAYLDSLPAWSGDGVLTLENIKRVLESLGNPQDNVKAIHVAGTNGKGSVCAYIASILGASGCRVGLTTSPHLFDPNERIVIDGLPISVDHLGEALCVIQGKVKDLKVELSFFETMVAAAFIVFDNLNLDFTVLETGLGGRLDATNVVTSPVVTVISTISYDHQHLLGETLEKIAREKAGIIKRGVPVVLGSISPEPLKEIIDVARELKAPIRRYGNEFKLVFDGIGKGIYQNTDGLELTFESALPGQHQLLNASLAIDVASLLKIPSSNILSGLANVKWPGRIERHYINGNEVIFDACHNEAGVETLINYLIDSNLGAINLVFGALKTKNWKRMVDLLLPHTSNWILVKPDAPNAVECEEVADYLSGFGINPRNLYSNYKMLAFELRNGKSNGTTIVAGSIYLMGKVRAELGIGIPQLWRREY